MSAQTKQPQPPVEEHWQFLESRQDSSRRQLFVKGTRLRASTVWMGILTNGFSEEEAAENWDISVEAVRESVAYAEGHRDLLAQESRAEKKALEASGYRIEPPPVR